MQLQPAASRGSQYHWRKIRDKGGYSGGGAHYDHNGNVPANDTNRHYDVSAESLQGGPQLWNWGNASNQLPSDGAAKRPAFGQGATRVPDVKSPFVLVDDGAGGYVGYGGPVTSAHVYSPDFVRRGDNSTVPLPPGQGLVVQMAGGREVPYRFGGLRRPS